MKKLLVACMVLSMSMQCTAQHSLQNFFSWLFSTHTKQEVVQQPEEKNEASNDAPQEVPEEVVENDEPEKVCLAQEDEEWVVAKLWKTDVSDEEKETFLHLLDILSEEDLGVQKILRCTRSNVKIQYKRLVRLWESPALQDRQFAQKVLDRLGELYSQASVK